MLLLSENTCHTEVVATLSSVVKRPPSSGVTPVVMVCYVARKGFTDAITVTNQLTLTWERSRVGLS